MIEFIFYLDKKSDIPMYIQLYENIKFEILHGKLNEGEKLPSIRKLSLLLHISKTTVITAYDQLNAEGYIKSIERSGFLVSKIPKQSRFIEETKQNHVETKKEKIDTLDLKNEYIEKEDFNFAIWKRCMGKVLNNYQNLLVKTGERQGEWELRKEISKYIYDKRGVDTSPMNIIIGAGAQTLLNILSPLLKSKGINRCLFEDPGFNRAKDIFRHNNIKLLPIAVNKQNNYIQGINEDTPSVFYTSPNNQFPTGRVTPINERIKLLEWSNRTNSYIIEDDYNSELRFPGKPIPSMKSLDKSGRVIYLGSFSSLLAPFVRISYMVLPSELLNDYNDICSIYTQTVSVSEQYTLALFLQEGHFERHIKRLRKRIVYKRDFFVNAINQRLKERCKIIGGETGAHLLLAIDTDKNEESIIRKAREERLLLSGLTNYTEKYFSKECILLLYYVGLKEEQLIKCVEIIAGLIK